MSKLKLQIILGSTREGRHADRLATWLTPFAHAFEVEVLDLRDWKLPMFQETIPKLGNLEHPTYSEPVVTQWNRKISEGDAYVIVTPEYNHGPPGELKNAIDSVFFSFGFRHKPVAFVGYSAGIAAGVRAIEQLNQIMIETEAVPVRTQILVPLIHTAFDAHGRLIDLIESAAQVVLEDLSWLATTLKAGRAKNHPRPPSFRLKRPPMPLRS